MTKEEVLVEQEVKALADNSNTFNALETLVEGTE